MTLELDRLARRALAIGDPHAAVDLLLKASEVVASASHRSDLLPLAALARPRGDHHAAEAPPRTAAPSHDPSPEGTQSTATAAYVSLTEGQDPEQVFHFVFDRIGDSEPLSAGDPELSELCYILLSCGLLAADAALWHTYRGLLDRIGPDLPEPLRILSNIAPDVARTHPDHLQELDDALDHVSHEGDPYAVLRLGIARSRSTGWGSAATRCGTWLMPPPPADRPLLPASRRSCACVSTTARQGSGTRPWSWRGRGSRCATRTPSTSKGYTFRMCQALVAAYRGDNETAAELAAKLSAWALPRGVHLLEYQSAYVRALAALGLGDFESAYQQASSISKAGTLAPFNGQAVWVCLDLVEAAVHTDRLAEAVAHTRTILDSSVPISPRASRSVPPPLRD